MSLQAIAYLAGAGLERELVDGGAVEAAVAAMRANAGSDVVTREGLRLLEALTADDDDIKARRGGRSGR